MTVSELINPATAEALRTVEQTDEAGVDDAVADIVALVRECIELRHVGPHQEDDSEAQADDGEDSADDVS